jgi:hypothetical protein
LLLLFVLGPVHAQEKRLESPDDRVITRVVTIGDKSAEFNFIFVGERRYRVAHTAVILDKAGREIPLRLLYTPTRAKITFHVFGYNRDPLVTEIRVR